MSQDALTTMMASARPRFGFIDALILIAAMALGFGAYQIDPSDLESALGLVDTQTRFEAVRTRQANRQGEPRSESLAARLGRWRATLVNMAEYFLPFVTLGVAAATFRHRAARSRRALRYAGVVTSAVAAIFIAVSLINEFVLRRFPILQAGYRHNAFEGLWSVLGEDTSLGVMALWGILVLGRRWRAAPDWTDRLGRAVGAAWIVVAILGVLLKYSYLPR
jgi:hypothetical protein